MKTTLISISTPKNIPEVHTAQEFIAYTARVSNPGNQTNSLTAGKLIKYLAKNAHWSPFEMVSICIEVQTTRDIARQILRHRSFSFQEFSQRYAAVNTADFETRETRLQDTKNRQNSIECDDDELKEWFEGLQSEVAHIASDNYRKALDAGIAKEQARALLPEGLTPSTVMVAGTLRSWIHFCQLRMANGTQKEHQLIAKSCWELLLQEIPILAEIEFE